jgi:2-keto-4-pentenoate hydratase
MNQSAMISALVSELSVSRTHALPLEWPAHKPPDLPTAYAAALAVRAARIGGGDTPVGYKVGFTNRTIWPIYGVYAPIWGTVWRSTLSFAGAASQGEMQLMLSGFCEPRIEPEVVFGFRSPPPAGCTLGELTSAVGWVAHGFEIVHTHFPNWKFSGPQAVADGGLHGHLLVGRTVEIPPGVQAEDLAAALSGIRLRLWCDGQLKDEGTGANVLDGPLQALLHFVQALRSTPGAPALAAGDVVTTGTLTNAHSVQAGQTWHTDLGMPDTGGVRLDGLKVRFEP